VPVPRAIAASSALPILYAPVSVNGRDYVEGGLGDVAHVDLAEQAGCRLVIVINPMVPVHAERDAGTVPTGHGRKDRIREKGVIWVYNQAMRMRMEARLKLGFERFKREHPETTVALIEPESTNASLFMHSPMNFAARRAILEEGYNSTRRALSDPSSPLRQTLEQAGFTMVAT
jgi:predicted acylesterase/phospholipase RssA